MNLIVRGHHLEVTPALRGYVEGKMERVRRHFDKTIDADVLLSVPDKLRHKAEATLRVSGASLHAEAIEADLYAAIDVLMDKLDRQVLRHKDKVKDHSHQPLKHQAAQSQQ
ncbi:MAG: ribosome hibernation-promoting factor, HPF/YfiA family [Betaproteobacteria bacterium]|jgi:putative sigma-54 modulation protein